MRAERPVWGLFPPFLTAPLPGHSLKKTWSWPLDDPDYDKFLRPRIPPLHPWQPPPKGVWTPAFFQPPIFARPIRLPPSPDSLPLPFSLRPQVSPPPLQPMPLELSVRPSHGLPHCSFASSLPKQNLLNGQIQPPNRHRHPGFPGLDDPVWNQI